MLLAQAPLPARSFLHGQPTNRAVPFRQASRQHLSRSARRRQTAARRAPRAGLLDFFTGGGGGGSQSSPKKDELVEELYDAVKGTDAGLKASPEERERIEDLVSAASMPRALYALILARHRGCLHGQEALT